MYLLQFTDMSGKRIKTRNNALLLGERGKCYGIFFYNFVSYSRVTCSCLQRLYIIIKLIILEAIEYPFG